MWDLVGKNLVVVDMQPDYRQSQQVIDQVASLLEHAVAVEAPVFILEFGDERTWPQLRRCVERYDMRAILEKFQCDGSDEVLDACRRGLYETDAFVLCGVDANVCVFDTACALAAKLPDAKIAVAKAASASADDPVWERFVDANVTLLDGLPSKSSFEIRKTMSEKAAIDSMVYAAKDALTQLEALVKPHCRRQRFRDKDKASALLNQYLVLARSVAEQLDLETGNALVAYVEEQRHDRSIYQLIQDERDALNQMHTALKDAMQPTVNF